MNFDIVRAWKDMAYRASLTAEQRALVPASPAGEIELSDAELHEVQGASGGSNVFSIMPAAAAICVQSNLAAITAPGCISVGGGDCLNFGG